MDGEIAPELLIGALDGRSRAGRAGGVLRGNESENMKEQMAELRERRREEFWKAQERGRAAARMKKGRLRFPPKPLPRIQEGLGKVKELFEHFRAGQKLKPEDVKE